MRRPLSELARTRWWHRGLAACALGAVAAPLGYIVMGAPARFASGFSMFALPLVVAAMGYAFYSALQAPRNDGRPPSLIGGLLLLFALVVIAVFLFVVSNFTLLQPRERIGLLATIFLAASVCCLPLVLWRRGALVSHVTRMPSRLSASLFAGVLLLAVAAAVLLALRAPAFI